MDALFEVDDRDVLRGWVGGRGSRRQRAADSSGAAVVVDGLRFAFYGRTSTAEFQDPVSSRAWQREMAESVVAGHGVITCEFFDVGCSRRVSWARRPQAAVLLAQAQTDDRPFDAVVVGEFERAFTAGQFQQVARALRRHGVMVWLPEAVGPVDLDDTAGRILMSVLAAQSQREVLRSRHRTLAAMTAQTVEQGRYLGGRPPYGYRLVDAGPHPNRTHAQWGRRLRRLDPDPVTAPHMRWMFAQRLTGRSVAGIARELNERGVPRPSDADPGRNPHRHGGAWSLRTVEAILGNPRYTGRQVWNRQRVDYADGAAERGRNPSSSWTVSKGLAHTALVSESDFVAAQEVRAARATKDGTTREYVLAGLLRCGVCGRRMDAHWVHGRAGYRCRHGHSSARSRPPGTPRNVYVREDELLARLTDRLASERDGFDGGGPTNTAEVVAQLRRAARTIICDLTGWRVAAGG